MNQPSFNFAAPTPRVIQTPAARRTDPITSHLAAAEHTASGKRAHQQSQAIAAVNAFPGLTSFELAMRTGIDRFTLARRLPECRPHAVVNGEPKRCSVTGKLALTWLPVSVSEARAA